jgi:hypothetical protein
MGNEREVLGLLVSEWSALGTVAAVIVSLVVGFLGWRGSRRAEEQLRAEGLKAQASKVAAWQSGRDNTPEGYALTVLNNSDLPIYHVHTPGLTTLNTNTGKDEIVDLGTMPPLDKRRASFGFEHGDITESWELQFTDANGTKWSRTADGVLSVVRKPATPIGRLVGKSGSRPYAG